ISYKAPTLKLKGTPQAYFALGQRYGDQAALADMLATTVKGALLAQKGEIVKQIGRIVISPNVPVTRGFGEADRLQNCYAANSPLMAYKARPLDGIWATAPYLHNGSVPNLNALLTPPAQRPSEFYVGTRVYDPVNVGYRTDQAAPGNVFKF